MYLFPLLFGRVRGKVGGTSYPTETLPYIMLNMFVSTLVRDGETHGRIGGRGVRRKTYCPLIAWMHVGSFMVNLASSHEAGGKWRRFQFHLIAAASLFPLWGAVSPESLRIINQQDAGGKEAGIETRVRSKSEMAKIPVGTATFTHQQAGIKILISLKCSSQNHTCP